MKNKSFKQAFIVASMMLTIGCANQAMAYGLAGPVLLDSAGNNASSTDLAQVNCPEGTDHFSAAVQDMSAPVSGLLVNLHILNENASKMATATDQVSGDGQWSPIISVYAGPGTYYLSVDKTHAGSRFFYVGWDCRDAANNSTGIDIQVLQVQ